MSHDFRCIRKKLPPEAFAYSEGPDLPPQDLIDKDIWSSIISLPDDVSLRTSDDHGTELKFMDGLWSSIIESVGETEDVMWHSLLDVADELKACTVNSIIGFYRVAASCLRNSLELSARALIASRTSNSIRISNVLPLSSGGNSFIS